MTPTVQQAVPFFMVTNLEASTRFYVQGLGFAITQEWRPDFADGRLQWCWLQLGGAALMLQEYRQEGQAGGRPQGAPGEGVSIYFLCDDAIAVYRDLLSRGVPAGRPFVGNGMWVTALTDPDGYKLYFESPTDAAEETVLSD